MIYMVNGSMIDEDIFKRKILNMLEIYHYASIEELSLLLRAKHRDINYLLDGIIISYIKANPSKTYNEICKDLKVRSQYIERLIEDGRVEKKEITVSESEINTSIDTTTSIKENLKKEIILELKESMEKNKVKEVVPIFHTRVNKNKDNKMV